MFEKKDDDESCCTSEIARDYVKGFDEYSGSLKKRRLLERGKQKEVGRFKNKNEGNNQSEQPKFIPPEFYGETSSSNNQIDSSYRSYNFCSSDDEKEGELNVENAFWRDGEKVILNDGDDCLSTDYQVRCVYKNILKTLNRFYVSRNTAKKTIKCELTRLKKDCSELNVDIPNRKKHYLRIVSVVNRLILAIDTSKGNRKFIVNHLHPATCRVSDDVLTKLCRFNCFGSVSSYGYLDCNFHIPVKLIFMGNLKTDTFEENSSGRNSAAAVYNIELCKHFGTYFYGCLENIYQVCFEKLENEVERYRKNKALRDARHDTAVNYLKAGDMSALMRYESTNRSDFVKLDEFFGNVQRLRRQNKIRILGTSGRTNFENRLRYTLIDETTTTSITEGGDPEDEVDALFVSSFIGFRIQRDGLVFMNVYTRHALKLETGTTE